jgi:hypothetical protein
LAGNNNFRPALGLGPAAQPESSNITAPNQTKTPAANRTRKPWPGIVYPFKLRERLPPARFFPATGLSL